jgi:peptidoglycan hydrolase-like protein with peptidoglycan-binding domain
MNHQHGLRHASAIAVVSLLAGCASWHAMDRAEQRGTAGSSATDAGAKVPAGASVGTNAAAYAGSSAEPSTAGEDARTSAMARIEPGSSGGYDTSLVRAVQQSLNDRGFVVAVDGLWGSNTQVALHRFQQAQGMQGTGELDPQTMAALKIGANRIAAAESSPMGDEATPGKQTMQRNQSTSPRQGQVTAPKRQAEPKSDRAVSAASGSNNQAPSATRDRVGMPTLDTNDASLVRAIQQALAARGFKAGSVDGMWGPATKNALQRFQEAQGIDPTGQLNPQTMSALSTTPPTATATGPNGMVSNQSATATSRDSPVQGRDASASGQDALRNSPSADVRGRAVNQPGARTGQ